MTDDSTVPFAALGRSVSHSGHGAPSTEAAYRELWAARRLLQAVRAVIADADWEAGDHADHACVPKHHLVLLEAAANAVTGERAPSSDGFPHAGPEVSGQDLCNAGYCPCHDAGRQAQPRLLDPAA